MSDEDLDTHEFKSADEMKPGCILFSNVSPNDLQQGGLGDCWLLSAMAAIAEYPDFVESIIQESGDGTYTVKLYSFASEKFETIEIDGCFPSENDDFAYVSPSKQNEIWPCVLEKAFAKSAGGYKQLDGGFSVFAFGKLTGCQNLENIDIDDGQATICSYHMASDDPQDQDSEEWGDTEGDPMDTDQLMDLLAQYDSQKYLMCAGSKGGSDKDFSAKHIVQGHAYSILQVAKNPAGSDFNLIKLRNPWGSDEWNGAWADGDDVWTEHPEVAEALEYEAKEDGTFWMPFENFCNQYNMVFVAKYNMARAGQPCGACCVM